MKKYELINYDGESYFKIDSLFNDVETGAALDTYYRADDDAEYYLIRNLDGTFELNF